MASSVTDHRYLRIDEAAVALRCSRSSVYRYVDRGVLPAYRIGGSGHGPLRIRAHDLEQLLRPARSPEARP